ncbi:growth arrest and DNA-damage-inducible proteins-interacting protein 1 domain-containing protein [Phthorimaea operculella]|nr:growth arrest and DNA-damage-inducible proteins-interacting protein 1 domain-containing protein [Phthorimaea operculella]
MNLCVRSKCLRTNFIGSLYRYSTTTTEAAEQSEAVLIDDSDDAQAREAELERKRNVSRLSPAHYNVINGRRPYEEPKHTAHLTVKYNRKMYGKYGIASGVNLDCQKESEAKAAKEKKERLVEEVRRHFGFKLDPRDERFQEMLAREKEQKKAENRPRRMPRRR